MLGKVMATMFCLYLCTLSFLPGLGSCPVRRGISSAHVLVGQPGILLHQKVRNHLPICLASLTLSFPSASSLIAEQGPAPSLG